MINKFNKEIEDSHKALSALELTIEELLSSKGNGSNGKGLESWFALVKFKDSIRQMVNNLLEIEKEVSVEEESTKEVSRDSDTEITI